MFLGEILVLWSNLQLPIYEYNTLVPFDWLAVVAVFSVSFLWLWLAKIMLFALLLCTWTMCLNVEMIPCDVPADCLSIYKKLVNF